MYKIRHFSGLFVLDWLAWHRQKNPPLLFRAGPKSGRAKRTLLGIQADLEKQVNSHGLLSLLTNTNLVDVRSFAERTVRPRWAFALTLPASSDLAAQVIQHATDSGWILESVIVLTDDTGYGVFHKPAGPLRFRIAAPLKSLLAIERPRPS